MASACLTSARLYVEYNTNTFTNTNKFMLLGVVPNNHHIPASGAASTTRTAIPLAMVHVHTTAVSPSGTWEGVVSAGVMEDTVRVRASRARRERSASAKCLGGCHGG